MSGQDHLLRVVDLRKYFPVRRGIFRSGRFEIRAVDGVSFHIDEKEIYALVGESGSGKSTIGRTILRLEEPTAGRVIFRGTDLTPLSEREMRPFRREMQIIFQDPFGSLNPRLTARRALVEALVVHRIVERDKADERAEELLEVVGIDPADSDRYPHEFSGGQRQRVCIARSLAISPRFLVADEPVSSLDVSIQAQIINLLFDLRERLGLTLLLITHNLALVRHAADRVGVLYLGRIVEEGRVEDLFGNPMHPYTKALLSATPVPEPGRGGSRELLRGESPSPIDPPSGCPFHPRCVDAIPECSVTRPLWSEGIRGHRTACHRYRF